MKEVDFNIRIAYWHYEAVIVQESSEFSLPLFFHTTSPLFFLQRCFPWPLTAVSELVLFLNQEDPLYCICVERYIVLVSYQFSGVADLHALFWIFS